jgi:hypothetical protein
MAQYPPCESALLDVFSPTDAIEKLMSDAMK